MYKQIIFIALIVLSRISLLNAQEVLTLESAIQIALNNNYNIKVAKNDSEIAKNNATKGNAGLLPSVSVSSGLNYSEHASDELSSSAGLNLSYTLFDGFGGRYNYQILNLQKEQGDLVARFNIENTISNVISGFYELNKAYDKFQTASKNLEISKERLLRNQSKYEFGNISKLEVLNSKVDFNSDSTAFLQAQQNYDAATRKVNVLLGRNAETTFQLIPDNTDFQVFSLIDLKKETLEKNAEYLIAANQLHQSETKVKETKSGQLPTVSLNSSYSYYENKIAGTNSNTQLSGGLTVSFNIFDGKRKQTQIANAKIDRLNSELEYQNTMLELEKDLVDAYADYQYSLKILALQEAALEAAQLNFDQTMEYYQLGQVTSTTFREAQQNLIEAINNKSAARFDAKLSEVSIKKISGTLLISGL